jgi:hypothetical protein
MEPEELSLVRKLLTEARVLSLGVLVDGRPHVGLLPFVTAEDYRSALIHVSGTVQLVAQADSDFDASRQAYIDRFPSSEQTFHLGDFNLYRLHFEWGRLVSGFARAITLSPDSFRELSES